MSEFSAYRILVLDDHVEMAEAVAELLEFEGHSMRIVHNGPAAVEAFRQEDFDLAFFDIRMPGMNGVEAFMSVKNEKPNASVVMMSGFADEGLIQTALQNGAMGLLTKPFNPENLLGFIEEFSTSHDLMAERLAAAQLH
ncbi:MAG: response regulator [Hyphomicrobiaceae bacterium]